MEQTHTIELNGFRHPVSAQVMLLTEEDRPFYLQFTQTFAGQFKPATPLEVQLAFAIADAQWRLNSVRALQNNMLAVQLAASAGITAVNEPKANAAVIGAQVLPKKAPTLASLSLIEQRVHREFHHDLKFLREVQAERRAAEQRQLEQAAALLQLEKSKAAPGEPLAYQPSEDGIALPLEQVEAHLRLTCRHREAVRLSGSRAEPPRSSGRKSPSAHNDRSYATPGP